MNITKFSVGIFVLIVEGFEYTSVAIWKNANTLRELSKKMLRLACNMVAFVSGFLLTFVFVF